MNSANPERRSSRFFLRLMAAPVALLATTGLLAGSGIASPTVSSVAPQPSSGSVRTAQPVDPDFGSLESESAAESVALNALAATAEMTLSTLSELAEEGQLNLPEADASGAELQRLLDRAAVQRSGTMEKLFDKIGPDNHFKGSRKLNAAELQVGDVFVSSTAEVVSQIIKVATWGQFSHAALHIGDGQVVDATAKGITRRSLKEFPGEANRVGVLRVKQLAGNTRGKIVGHARELIGKEYSYRGLAGLALDRMSCFARPVWESNCSRRMARLRSIS